jgi:hypothetical protein
LALVAQLLLEVVCPLETVLFVVSEEGTVGADLFPICCAYDVHHDLVLGAHLAERWGCWLGSFVVKKVLAQFIIKKSLYWFSEQGLYGFFVKFGW